MTRLQQLGTPILSRIGAMGYTDLLGLYDAHVVNGRHHALQTRWLADLTPDIVDAVIAAGMARTSPHSLIALHHFHGGHGGHGAAEAHRLQFPLRLHSTTRDQCSGGRC